MKIEIDTSAIYITTDALTLSYDGTRWRNFNMWVSYERIRLELGRSDEWLDGLIAAWHAYRRCTHEREIEVKALSQKMLKEIGRERRKRCGIHKRFLQMLNPTQNLAPAPLVSINGLQTFPLWEGGWVYFLVDGQAVVYVGQSTQLCGRIASHYTERAKQFDSVFCLPVEYSRLDAEELRWIRHLKPKYNRAGMCA